MSNTQSKFVKQVLVEEAEYDRLRQNHYRNYSPQIRAMDKLQEFILETMMRKDLDPQQKIDLCSGPRQRFNQLKEETNTLSGESSAAGTTGPKVQTEVEQTETKVEPTEKQEPTVIKNDQVKKVEPTKANNLIDLITNNPNIIRRTDANELEVNGHAVVGTDFDELYSNLFSPNGTQHLPGMTELLGALRQLNAESKDIVSHPIQAAFESATPRSGPLRHNEKAIPQAPKPNPKSKAKPKSKRTSTTALKNNETGLLKHETRSTTKYNMPRKGLSNQQSGNGLKIPRILYVY
jgi:hypothetical protein